MDAEPLPPLDLPTPSDAEMRIDYGDEEPAGADVPMGDEPIGEETTLEEAVMGDAEPGDAVVQEEEGDAILMEEVQAPVSAELDQPAEEETGAVDVPSVTESAFVDEQHEFIPDEDPKEEGRPKIIDESIATSQPPTTFLATPEPAVAAILYSTLPTATDEIAPSATAVVNGEVVSGAKDGADSLAPSNPSEGQQQEQEQSVDLAAQQEASTADEEGQQAAEDVHAVVVVEEAFGEDGTVGKSVETTQGREPGGEVETGVKEQGESAAIVEVISEEVESIFPTSRPSLNKSLLAVIELPSSLPSDSAADVDVSSSLTAPTVLLSYQNETYSVFRRHESTDDTEDALDRSLPVLFEQADKHELYYDQVERFIESLHGLFPELASGEEELVLELPEIGIALPEDNIYTRQVCLEDLDRVHVGCGLAGRLLLQLSAQPRFASGFNALVDHIANSHGKAVDLEEGDALAHDETAPIYEETIAPADEDTEDSYVNVEELRDDDTAAPESGAEEGAEGGEEHFEDGEWHDEDVVYEGGDGDYEEHQDGEHEHEHDYEGSGEEVDFEEALADMDSEDLNAMIEGAQEDYVLAEGAIDGSDEVAGGAADVGEEQVEGESAVVGGGDGEHSGAVDAAADGAEAQNAVVEQSVTVESAVEDSTSEPVVEDAQSLVAADATTSDLSAPPIVEISYDTPLGTGDEPPAVPLEQLDAVVDAAAKLGSSPLSLSNGVAVDEAVKGLDELEEPSNDVVIDYEDAEEVTATTTLPPPSSKDSPMTPKRAREDPDEEVPAIDEESAAGDAKRPRLSDLKPETTPITASTA